ncbi:MAG TPA: DOMON-like domain-containing protein, partial [Ottowia sp.]|nr:DOMON-like domain-containing protein [Ottowia sp.]
PAVHELRVTVEPDPAQGGWWLRYTLGAALAALRLPPPAAQPGPADGLWRHTCFEAFVGAARGAAYHEFNFSPSGHWAAYAFSAPRQRASAGHLPLAPRLQWRQGVGTLTLDAWLPQGVLPSANTPHALGLSAVIETDDGRLSYWALAHPAPQPDFHHRAGWTARLP